MLVAINMAGLSGPANACEAPFGADIRVLSQAVIERGGIGVYVARDDRQAAAASRLAQFFAPQLDRIRFSAWDCLPYDRVSPAPIIASGRCAQLSALARRRGDEPLLVLTTASALIQRVPPREVMSLAVMRLEPGLMIELDKFCHWLVNNGYSRASLVREAGDYAVRGGIIDVFAPGSDKPVRLDCFGDMVESIRLFDPQTQQSLTSLERIDFVPAGEIIFDDDTISEFRRNYVEEFGPARDDPDHAAVLERIRKQGMEHWLPLFYPKLETLFDYFGDEALLALDEQVPAAVAARLSSAEDYYRVRCSADLDGNRSRILPPERLYLSADDLQEQLFQRVTVRFNPASLPESGPESGQGGELIRLRARQGYDFAPVRAADKNVFDAVIAHVRKLEKSGQHCVFAAWSAGSAERLHNVLSDHDLETLIVNSWPEALRAKLPVIAELPLNSGFESDDLAVISEQDILGDRMIRRRSRRSAESVISEAAVLAAGDLVVHVDHGVGRYRGLRTVDVAGAHRDCLDLVYAGGDTVLLPVENIELISRYGSEASDTVLDRLGGASWQARKARAKKKILDMAADLIRIAAQRQARILSPAYPPEGMFDEFCVGFPYEETEDQLKAVEDVLEDLASGKPMDRLICGDVGFGKTEIALRAAFIVLMSGMQVAIIAPTTLLARQHMETVKQRFANWPVNIGRLSRLVSAPEAAQTRKALVSGGCDLVIGTHAILSDSVKFSNLGLIIVDEEQRFGVRHKERMKELRSDVHVLTLSATPIPRTLQMSLSGIRDLSAIATPPLDRLSVRTYVLEFDPVAMREALLRERYRGGQSYIVAPRIADLPVMESFLREQVPEISFLTAHGQMAAGQLDTIMTDFYEGRADALLATNIVESGLDVPRANTLIVCRADLFGLGQLHQLRGRVGRSRQRAYAYLTVPAGRLVSEGAQRRLKLLSSLDSLGAGFSLASHDLDMRGGGNLLGDSQSGHIREVGAELYQQMLSEAVESLKGEDKPQQISDWSPRIDLGVDALISEEYVPDLSVRLSLYRQFAVLGSGAEQDAFAAELIDRFGSFPPPVANLFAVNQIKNLCKQLGAGEISSGPKGILIRFRNDTPLDPARLIEWTARQKGKFRLRPDSGLIASGSWPDAASRLGAVAAILHEIAAGVGIDIV